MNPGPADASRSPAPRPAGARLLRMTWSELLFVHWPVSSTELQECLPAPLEVDLFAGQAWVSTIALRMTGVRPVLAPPIPGLSSFLQINVRTYVRKNGHSGVYFFSLDATSPVAVWLGRTFLDLPYFRARVHTAREDHMIRIAAKRIHQGARPATFACTWSPDLAPLGADEIELARFLTERYRLFAVRNGRVFSFSIWHGPWQLRRAGVSELRSTMLQAAGLPAPVGEPFIHHADALAVELWPQRDEGAAPKSAPLLDPALAPPPANFAR